MTTPPTTRARRGRRTLGLITAGLLLAGALPGTASAADPDPRVGLGGGWLDAQSAISNLEHVAHRDKPAGFVDPTNPGNGGYYNSDLAFGGRYAFQGNYNGFTIVDIADPAEPTLVTSVVCPGGQGDLSVQGNLLFMSVEESRGRVDCGTNPNVGTRFQGVRVFDISDVRSPVQVAAVQLCRGSHTHSVVTDPRDADNVYVYVSGTTSVRPATTMEGCNNNAADGENPSRWRIDVIKVPVAAPQDAAVVNQPRLFQDPVTDRVDGLQNGPVTPRHPSGSTWSPTPNTNACHDITAYPEIGLAAGACQGNGILIDISDPANPKRIDEVADPNFAYWHSATFNNDGTKVIFTDEWGGGSGARCRDTDQPQWGANAIFDIVDRKMTFASYYKLPVPQSLQENCVAHNGSLIPVPGRDVMMQAWYQGGISVFDFTDSKNPREIAYFDRGPVNPNALVLGGFWSAYWYNGNLYGNEIARGFDVFALKPSAHLSAAEIEAATQVKLAGFNAQGQPKISWTPSFALVRAYHDQGVRAGAIDPALSAEVDTTLSRASGFAAEGRRFAAEAQLRTLADRLDAAAYGTLRQAVVDLADTFNPRVSATVGPAEPTGNNGWYTGAVTLTLTGLIPGMWTGQYSVDDGVTWVDVPASGVATISAEVRGSVRYRAVDAAGNTSRQGSQWLKIDRTAPEVQVSGLTDGTAYGDSGTVTVDWTVTDTGSGPGINPDSALLDGKRVARGATVTLSGLPLGSHTLTVTAKDKAGNTTNRSVTFTTTTSFADLQALVDGYRSAGTVSAGNADKLTTSLGKAGAAAGSGQPAEAVTQLTAFLDQARALNAIGARNLLVRDAQALIDQFDR
ncbi:FIMAH domain-containing protein [Micromonospora sp.]|uniref:FIMAH domain-containing protein n=1 Tax=Micromonospora sp. TaxID=1876 RepID=UPI003B3B8A2C